mgnify:CR=1 FL=1
MINQCEIVKMHITELSCRDRTKNVADWCYECRRDYDVV